jgi:16S rRNA (guanine(527)-N(7))-methyltransferase RsmG
VIGERVEDLCQSLGRLAELVAHWSARINLTAHRDAAAVMRGLILEALALDQALPAVTAMVDLGSGAGFPGLPIALLHPERRVTLIEARERRHHFQRAAVRALSIENAVPRLGRAEALPAEPHPLVVAQAMARPDRALSWMLPWVAPGGALALPLSIDQARPQPIAGVSEPALHSYTVPLGGPRRVLWLARRAS